MIPTSINIPVDVDVSNPDILHEFLITMKQVIEDLSANAGTGLVEGDDGYVPPTFICDTDADTRVETEQSADEDKVRVDIASNEVAVFQATSIDFKMHTQVLGAYDFAVASGQKVLFEGLSGDNYWIWSGGYMALYVEGSLRAQF